LLHTDSHTHKHTSTHIFGRTSLYGDRPLETHNIQYRTSIPLAGFELALPAKNLLQTYASDRAPTGIGDCGFTGLKLTLVADIW